MDIWKKFIKDGDRLYNSLAYDLAKDKYIRALERSRYLYEHCANKVDAIDCIITSHFKLSDCLVKNLEFEFAGNVVLHCHRVVQSLESHNRGNIRMHSHLRSLQYIISQKLSYLVSQYPEVHVCEDCHYEIFGFAKNYQQSTLIN